MEPTDDPGIILACIAFLMLINGPLRVLQFIGFVYTLQELHKFLLGGGFASLYFEHLILVKKGKNPGESSIDSHCPEPNKRFSINDLACELSSDIRKPRG